MSSKYVPPHKRNQSEPQRRAVTFDTEKDFVPLASNETKTVNKVDWKAVTFENTQLPPPPPITSLPTRRPVVNQNTDTFYASESEYDSDIEETRHSQPLNDEGWTLVEKKVKPKRDKVQEALDNGDAPLSDEEEEQSYWDDQPEEYETYWDRKP